MLEMTTLKIIKCHHGTMVPVTIMYAASPATMGATMYPEAVAIDCVQLFSRIVKSSIIPVRDRLL